MLSRGSGVVSVSNPEPILGCGGSCGSFSYDPPFPTTKVTFDRDVSLCAYLATSGAANEVPARNAGQANLTGPVYVQPHWQPDFQGGVTKDPASVLVTVRVQYQSTPGGFHLAVFC